MVEMLRIRAKEIMDVLMAMPEVKNCALYGSLAEGTADGLSDIDINVDVSGSDNGVFMLFLAERLAQKIPVFYSDYAPSLVPEKYTVSIAIDENCPTCVVDLCCIANPHCTTVSRELVRKQNDLFSHILKLWTANWKHHVRGLDCRKDILRMAEKINLVDASTKDNEYILNDVLRWLEHSAPVRLNKFMQSCRREYEKAAASE